MVKDMLVLVTVIILLIGCIYFVRPSVDEEFNQWFEELLEEASKYGYTDEQIMCFEECDFEIYYRDGKTIEEALTENQRERNAV